MGLRPKPLILSEIKNEVHEFMQTLVTTLENLKATSKISDKTIILEAVQDPTTKRVLNFLGDPNQVIGLSTKKIQKEVEHVAHDLTLPELLDYLLEHNTGTENEIGMVQYFINQYDAHTKDVLAQVIGKSWTTTVGASLLNKVFGAGFIPVFEVQLAFPYDKKINGYSDKDVFVVTQKLDGFRAVVEVKDGKVVSVKTRKGKVIDGLTELRNDFEKVLDASLGHFIFDGELLLEDPENKWTSGERFQKTGQMISADGECQGLGYHIFDALPYAEFVAGVSKLPYIDRRKNYLETFEAGDLVRPVPVLGTADKAGIPAWSDYATAQGFEGVMLNDPHAKYEAKRTKGLLKVKKMHTADLLVVGFEEAIDGKNRGGLKSLIVQLDEDNTFNVSSGLTEEQREHIWNNQDEYLGKIIEIKFFEETTNKNGGRSLRFPVVLGFRDDKTAEDVNID
jgi:ATP dependent DNA ligase domain